ncbi:unnamed protein product, partial [Brassica rapa]
WDTLQATYLQLYNGESADLKEEVEQRSHGISGSRPPPPPPPLERNLAFNDFPLPPVVPSTEEVMNELGEVTVQYTNCDDPRERAATDGVYIIQHNSSCYFKPQRSLNKRECGTNIQP